MEDPLDLHFDVLLDSVEVILLVSVQLRSVDVRNVVLTLLQASSNLVWQPGSDWGSTSSSWILGVVNDIFLDHAPVLVSEPEGGVDVLQHQKR